MVLGTLLASIVAILCGSGVGLALGLTGGGGSIFAVPLLIYVLGLTPDQAMPISLVAVSISAIVGGVQSIKRRLAVWQPTIIFALGGVLGAPLGMLGANRFAERWIVGGFALLALTVGSLMWRAAQVFPAQAAAVRARTYEAGGGAICVLAPDGQLRFAAPCAAALVVLGLGTGFLSGMFGIGGGFLIVPALVLVTRMGVHRAVATSLLIIAAIGSAGAVSALLHGEIVWHVLLPFAAGGAAAMVAGRLLAERLAGPRLQKIFAIAIFGVGVGMLIDSFVT
jgi:uncharacterized membrane protein YfcA